MDNAAAIGNSGGMVGAGAVRDRLAGILKAAFADGLLSEQTLTHRLNAIFDQRLVDPHGVVGDLSLRSNRRQRSWPALATTIAGAYRNATSQRTAATPAPLVLALDWLHGESNLLIGRDPGCTVVLADHSVSREHARLTFRSGAWVIQDLSSTNGTIVNGEQVGRSHLQPGDRLQLGDQLLDVD